jgi:hypothetical protein
MFPTTTAELLRMIMCLIVDAVRQIATGFSDLLRPWGTAR